MNMLEKEIAQCVGLWLAEGSTNSIYEITLTNNLPNIIVLFHKVVAKLFPIQDSVRIYVYSNTKNKRPTLPIKNVKYIYYLDRRANKPYFIYRIANVTAVKKWHEIVNKFKENTKFYPFILQGIFAGEGNIKFIPKYKSRVLRISQGKPNLFLERIFDCLKIKYIFSPTERNYLISNRENLEKLFQLNISALNKEKDKKFKNMLKTYKQFHYPKGYLKNKISKLLDLPYTTSELANQLSRSQARISKILILLKKEKKVKNFRVRNKDYWIKKDKNVIIISKRKQEILRLLSRPGYTAEIADSLKIGWKATFRRLKELEKLNLVKLSDNLWYKISTNKEVIVF